MDISKMPNGNDLCEAERALELGVIGESALVDGEMDLEDIDAEVIAAAQIDTPKKAKFGTGEGLEVEQFETFMNRLTEGSEPYRNLMLQYRCALMEIETKFRVLNEQMSLDGETNPIESIKTRLKSPRSIYEKLVRKGYDLDLETIEEKLFDIAGVRVICSFPEDIYMLADCLLRQDDITLVERRDYFAEPKPSGYRSLHLIVEVPIFLKDRTKNVKVEVQLRTIAMDFWASLEHKLKYKKDIDPELQQELTRKLVACAETSAAQDLDMQQIRNKIAAARQA